MTNQNNAAQPVLTDLELLDVGAKHGRPSVSLLPMWRAVEAAVLSKLRAPVADERISLRGAANLAFNALHECKPVKGAEKQYSDAIQALQSALHDIAYTVNRTATPQQFADHLQREARAALAEQPAASAEPSDTLSENEWYDLAQRHATRDWNGNGYMAAIQAVCLDFLSRYGRPAGDAQPVAWVAADTLNSPHPTCISSLAYMSQIDRERGREYVPLAIIDRYAAPVAAQPAVNGYTCTVPDDCETLHWRGQVLSMNELASVAQPGVGEEIHVHIEGQDVLTLPLASSGMDAPRFVVHVPAQAQPDHFPGATEMIQAAAECLDTLTSNLNDQHPLRIRAQRDAKSHVANLYEIAAAPVAAQAQQGNGGTS